MSPLKQVLFNFHDVVLLITAYLCILFATLVLTRSDKRLQNALLACFLLCHAAIPMDVLISFGEAFSPWIAERAPNFFYIFGGAYWLEAPILLWYTRSLLYKNFTLKRYDYLFAIPFLFFVVDQAHFYSLSFNEQSTFLLESSVLTSDLSERIQSYARELIRFGFLLTCVFETYRYRKHIRHAFSNVEKIDFTWLNTMVIGFTALIFWQLLVMLALELAVGFSINADFETLGLLGNYATLGMVSLLIFYSLSHSTVFEGIDRQSLTEKETTKTQKALFSTSDIDKLTQHMDEHKSYLKSDLTINELAKLVGINHRQLSAIMNQHFEKNFFEFVNHYRIEEAKRLLKSEQHAKSNMLDIMFDVGFNSKATFNTFFKKYTGMTPTQYKKM